MSKLHKLFPGAEEGDRIKLTLAAYNAGMGRVFDAQALAAHLHMNPLSWGIRRSVPAPSSHAVSVGVAPHRMVPGSAEVRVVFQSGK